MCVAPLNQCACTLALVRMHTGPTVHAHWPFHYMPGHTIMNPVEFRVSSRRAARA